MDYSKMDNVKMPKIISRGTGFGIEHWYEGVLKSMPSDEKYNRLIRENEKFMYADDNISKLITYIRGNEAA